MQSAGRHVSLGTFERVNPILRRLAEGIVAVMVHGVMIGQAGPFAKVLP